METIYLWSDIRETSLHQKYIVLDYKDVIERFGFKCVVNQTRDWKKILEEVHSIKPKLFILHGDKIFPPEVLREINKKYRVYVRWRWHPDPPRELIDNCFIASKVSFVKNDYDGKLFYSPHPALTKYFYPKLVPDEKYKSNVFFVGLAGKRGNGFYQRSNRCDILKSKYVRYLNDELFGSGNEGFYNYPEIAKYYNAAKLALSISSFDDELNFRVFEAMACGVPLLSDTTRAMQKHFQPGFDYIEYDKTNFKGFENIVKLLLNNYENAKYIAEHGFKTIMSYHTSEIRLKQAFKKCGVL